MRSNQNNRVIRQASNAPYQTSFSVTTTNNVVPKQTVMLSRKPLVKANGGYVQQSTTTQHTAPVVQPTNFVSKKSVQTSTPSIFNRIGSHNAPSAHFTGARITISNLNADITASEVGMSPSRAIMQCNAPAA